MAQTLFRLFVFLSFPGLLLAQNALGYHLKEGDIFTVEQLAKQDIIQNLDNTSHQITNSVSGILQIRVVQDRDSAYLLEMMFQDLKFKIESSLQGVLFDVHAAEPRAGDAQSEVFHALLNIPVRMTLSKQGEILKVDGGDQLVAKVLDQSGIPEGFSRTVLKKSLEQQYGSQALAESYQQMTYFYPERAVRKGDHWTNESTGKLQAHNTWTLDSLNAETAYISGKARVVMKTDEPTNSMRLQGQQQTEITADLQTGFLRNMRVESQVGGISTSASLGDVEIPTTVESKVTYRLIAHKYVQ
jgi:hypothetical protein